MPTFFEIHRWLLGLRFIGSFLKGFRMPQAGSDAFLVLFASGYLIDSPATLWVRIVNVCLLILCFFRVIGFIMFHTGRYFSREEIPVPPLFELSVRNFLSLVPIVLFILWGVLFLGGWLPRNLSRAIRLVWLAYLVGGFLIGVGRGFGSVLRRRTA